MTNCPRRRNLLLDSPQGDIPPPHDYPRQAEMPQPPMALSVMGTQNTKPPVIPCNARLTTNRHIPTADNSLSILTIGGETPSLPIFDSGAENVTIGTEFSKQLKLTLQDLDLGEEYVTSDGKYQQSLGTTKKAFTW